VEPKHPAEQSRPPSNGERVSTQTKPGTGRALGIIAAVLIVALGAGFAISYIMRLHRDALVTRENSDMGAAAMIVDVVRVQPTAANYPFSLPGQTAGWYQSVLYSRVDGFIGMWFADIGDRVKQGQVLATIETPELDQQVNAANAQADASEAEVTVAQANASIAEITYKRWWESPKGVVSEQERQEKKATYESAKAHLLAAQAQAHLDRAKVDQFQAMEAFKKVVAPYDGVITARHIDIRDLVTAGSTASTSSLYSIAQSNIIRVFVDVPQKASADMVVGLPAHVVSDQFPSRIFEGKVTRSTMSIDPSTRTQRTEVDIPNADLALVPGMNVEVTFELNQKGLLEVPASAILFRPAGLEVAVVDADGKVSLRKVTIAKDDGQTVELSTGIKPNERVALNLSSEISDGQKVQAVLIDSGVGSPPPPPPAPAVETTGPPDTANSPPNYTPVPNTGMHPPFPATAPSRHAGPSGPGPVHEPPAAPQPAPSKARADRPAAGVGGASSP